MNEIPCWRLMMNRTEHSSSNDDYDPICGECGEYNRDKKLGDGYQCKLCHYYCIDCDNEGKDQRYKPDKNGSFGYLWVYNNLANPSWRRHKITYYLPCECKGDEE
jgi:hypothetical protein